jgi:hypothetical protein
MNTPFVRSLLVSGRKARWIKLNLLGRIGPDSAGIPIHKRHIKGDHGSLTIGMVTSLLETREKKVCSTEILLGVVVVCIQPRNPVDDSFRIGSRRLVGFGCSELGSTVIPESFGFVQNKGGAGPTPQPQNCLQSPQR